MKHAEKLAVRELFVDVNWIFYQAILYDFFLLDVTSINESYWHIIILLKFQLLNELIEQLGRLWSLNRVEGCHTIKLQVAEVSIAKHLYENLQL